jgi:hypothetical protein
VTEWRFKNPAQDVFVPGVVPSSTSLKSEACQKNACKLDSKLISMIDFAGSDFQLKRSNLPPKSLFFQLLLDSFCRAFSAADAKR